MLSHIKNLFSTGIVKQKIINGRLSEGQLFFYFYIILTFDAYNYVQGWFSIAGKSPRIDDVVQAWGTFFYSAIGLIILFIINGGTKGKDFIAKYFSFSFTVGIKYFIAYIVFGFLPVFIHVANIPAYNIFVFFLLNTVMVMNFAYQIYLTKMQMALK